MTGTFVFLFFGIIVAIMGAIAKHLDNEKTTNANRENELAPGIPRASNILVQMVAVKMLASIENLSQNNCGTEWKWTSENKLMRIEFSMKSHRQPYVELRLRKAEKDRWVDLIINKEEVEMLRKAAWEASRLYVEKKKHDKEMANQHMAIDYIELLMGIPPTASDQSSENDSWVISQ